jgi:RNA recognition motif-containing protein
MRSAGEVTRADIMTGHDGRSKGCGIVEYATEEEAKKAVLTLNDTELKGRQIFVREDREEKGAQGVGNRFSSDEQAQSRRVYVGNLSWDVAWQDLKDHMVSVGREAQELLFYSIYLLMHYL